MYLGYQAKSRVAHRAMCILVNISFRETYFIVALYTIGSEMFGSRFKFGSRFDSNLDTHIWT